MNQEILEKYRKAGNILISVRKEAIKKVTIGASMLETAEFIENLIREKGGQPAFPCNISQNEEAAHATPSINDSNVFGEDMVKLDIGVMIDGYIADTAVTVDLSGNPDLVEASESALNAAIAIIKDGVNTAEIGEVIEQKIQEYGYKPIINLTGHGLAQYATHIPPSIPNKKITTGVYIKTDDVIAIEPFATNGIGKVSESGTPPEIYHIVSNRPARSPIARNLLKELKKYKELPFAKRWLKTKRIDYGLKELESKGIVKGYPILKEVTGGLVSQAEHTVIVTENGCEVITA